MANQQKKKDPNQNETKVNHGNKQNTKRSQTRTMGSGVCLHQNESRMGLYVNKIYKRIFQMTGISKYSKDGQMDVDGNKGLLYTLTKFHTCINSRNCSH